MIAASDLHLRRTVPENRTDDFFAAQERKLRFILELAVEDPPLVIPGDFFEVPKPGPFMEQWVISLLKEYQVKPIIVPGQHDLPFHSLKEIPDSGLGVLAAAGVIELMDLSDPKKYCWSSYNYTIAGVPYGSVPPPHWTFPPTNTRIKVLLWHHMVINDPLWAGQEAEKAGAILRKYKQFDLIITGDNHQSFAISSTLGIKEEGKARWLINPGSMMRTKINQIDHKPCVFSWDGNRPIQIFLPIEPDVLDLSKSAEEKVRDERVAAFVERLGTEYDIGLSFKDNLIKFIRENPLDKPVEELIWRCYEESA